MKEISLWGKRVNILNSLRYLRFYQSRRMSTGDFEALCAADALLVAIGGDVEGKQLVVMNRDKDVIYGDDMPDIRWPVMSHKDIKEFSRNNPGKNSQPICGASVTVRGTHGRSGNDTICKRTAGSSTGHFGIGHCSSHSGKSRHETVKAAWLMAHAFAREMDITPWEALLKAVRIAAGKLEYAQYVLSQATHDLEIEGRVVRGDDGMLVHPDTGEPLGVGGLRDMTFWVKQSELWHERLLRSSKAAIDSGIAERLMAGQTLQVQLISRVVEAGLGTLRLSPGDEMAARAAMRAELTRIDNEKQAAIAGELIDSIVVGPEREQV